jgi:hypothetical protein
MTSIRSLKHLQGGKKLGLDMERIDFSNNHNERLAEVGRLLEILRRELNLAQRDGRRSKEKKLRRMINQELEVELYLRHSWCGGCHNVLHNCTCKTG